MASSDIIQFRVTSQVKADFEKRCKDRGESVSEAARKLLMDDLYAPKSPLEKLNEAFASADEKLDAGDLTEPTVDEIVAYCKEVRAERSSQMLAS